MKLRTLFSASLFTAMSLGTAATAISSSATAATLEHKPITMGYVDWADQLASTNVLRVVLEDQGINVKTSSLSAAAMWQATAIGDVDVISTWLPVTHANYYKRFKKQVDNLGSSFNGARLGLVVPDYVTDVNTIEDLKDKSAQFENQIIGIDPGAGIMSLTEKVMKSYGLNNMSLASGSDATMTAVLANAIERKKPIVITGWTPHWMFARWHLKYLEDPKGIYGGEEEIETIARKGLKEDNPKAYCILSHFKWNTNEMGNMMMLNQKQGSDPYANAKVWVKNHPDTVNSWVKECQ